MDKPNQPSFGPSAIWVAHKGLQSWAKMANSSTLVNVFNVAKEERQVQPISSPSLESVAPALEITGGLHQATVCKTPSVTSQSSLTSNSSKCSLRDIPGSPLPLGSLQPSLYTRREGPLVIRHDDNVGRLNLTTDYDFDRSDFQVHLIEGHDLKSGEFCEPFIRICLDPAVDGRVRQVSTKGETNPIFDQVFKFPVSHEQLSNHTLVLQAYDYDRYSRQEMVGQLKIDLADLDLTLNEIWADIVKIDKVPEHVPEVLVSLSYLPSAERLTVVLLKAKNLYLPENRETLDPFVKVSLLSNGKRVKKKKTACRKSTTNPVWNEALTFNIGTAQLLSSSIEVSIMDQGSDLIGAPSLIGSSLILQTSKHWVEMSSNPRKAVAMWHHLR